MAQSTPTNESKKKRAKRINTITTNIKGLLNNLNENDWNSENDRKKILKQIEELLRMAGIRVVQYDDHGPYACIVIEKKCVWYKPDWINDK